MGIPLPIKIFFYVGGTYMDAAGMDETYLGFLPGLLQSHGGPVTPLHGVLPTCRDMDGDGDPDCYLGNCYQRSP